MRTKTILLLTAFALLASSLAADDRDLLKINTAKPYLFILLDTSASMNAKLGADELRLRADRRAQCGQVKKRTEAKLKDIDERIRTLRRMRRALAKLDTACDNEQVPTSECPILDALDREGR